MRYMAHSICLIKLYQITMRKKYQSFFSDFLKPRGYFPLNDNAITFQRTWKSSVDMTIIGAMLSATQ